MLSYIAYVNSSALFLVPYEINVAMTHEFIICF